MRTCADILRYALCCVWHSVKSAVNVMKDVKKIIFISTDRGYTYINEKYHISEVKYENDHDTWDRSPGFHCCKTDG